MFNLFLHSSYLYYVITLYFSVLYFLCVCLFRLHVCIYHGLIFLRFQFPNVGWDHIKIHFIFKIHALHLCWTYLLFFISNKSCYLKIEPALFLYSKFCMFISFPALLQWLAPPWQSQVGVVKPSILVLFSTSAGRLGIFHRCLLGYKKSFWLLVCWEFLLGHYC